jgi:SAM-dependent methyltransferase
MNRENPLKGQGVRILTLRDQAPNCDFFVNTVIYDVKAMATGKKVVDIGCGYGRTRKVVEAVGGEWTGVEPFEGGGQTVIADAESLPFENNSYDLAIMDSVLEHIPDASKAIAEVGRILKPNGYFVGYVAFMECFHEISYSHLSYKAMEHFAKVNGMVLEKIGGGRAFGIDYHLRVLLYPLPFNFMRKVIAACIRGFIKLKSKGMFLVYRFKKKMPANAAKEEANLYYKVECLRQSNGFQFVIRKL